MGGNEVSAFIPKIEGGHWLDLDAAVEKAICEEVGYDPIDVRWAVEEGDDSNLEITVRDALDGHEYKAFRSAEEMEQFLYGAPYPMEEGVAYVGHVVKDPSNPQYYQYYVFGVFFKP
ncbi:MAG: hypothetical protein Kow0069_01530 [Promethearchaeota archaeon]